MGPKDIEPSYDQVSAQLALVPVEEARGGGDVRADSGLSAGVESLEFEVGRHEKIDKLSVCSCSGSAGVDVGSDVVNFFAIFFNYNRTSSGSGICSKDYTSIEFDSDDGGSCFFIGDRFDDFFVL